MYSKHYYGKYFIFLLENYDECVYLDSDILILQNLDKMFDKLENITKIDKKLFMVQDIVESVGENIDNISIKKIVIAYEPIWAIGTGITATNKMVDKAHKDIRNILTGNGLNGNEISIIYGGSVTTDNVATLSEIKNVDGFLIGGASLDVDNFYNIYNQI